MSFADGVLDFFTTLIGGGCIFILSIASVICSLTALVSISEENRFFFERTLKTVGIVISFFGLLLPFRNISFVGTLICFGWTLLIYNVIPNFQVIQFTVISVSSFIFWAQHIFFSKESALQNIPDFIIYVIIPFIFTLANLSRGSESLTSKDRTGATGSKISLRSFNGKCLSLLDQIFPQGK